MRASSIARAKKKLPSERISQRAQLCLRKTVVSHLKKNKHGQWRLCKCYFPSLKSVCFLLKTFVFQRFKVTLLENTLPFWDCLYRSRRSRPQSYADFFQIGQIHRIHKWRTRGKNLVPNTETKNNFTANVCKLHRKGHQILANFLKTLPVLVKKKSTFCKIFHLLAYTQFITSKCATLEKGKRLFS